MGCMVCVLLKNENVGASQVDVCAGMVKPESEGKSPIT